MIHCKARVCKHFRQGDRCGHYLLNRRENRKRMRINSSGECMYKEASEKTLALMQKGIPQQPFRIRQFPEIKRRLPEGKRR